MPLIVNDDTTQYWAHSTGQQATAEKWSYIAVRQWWMNITLCSKAEKLKETKKCK